MDQALSMLGVSQSPKNTPETATTITEAKTPAELKNRLKRMSLNYNSLIQRQTSVASSLGQSAMQLPQEGHSNLINNNNNMVNSMNATLATIQSESVLNTTNSEDLTVNSDRSRGKVPILEVE